MPIALHEVMKHLEEIAPLRFAESWDNVGLLVQPPDGGGEHPVSQALLTIDLGERVLEEARGLGCELVIAYHPTIFHAFKRLTRQRAAHRVVLDAVTAGIAIYSPHTALDAAPGGMNDWLAEALGAGDRVPIEQRLEVEAGGELKLVVFVPEENVAQLREALTREAGAGWIGDYSHCSYRLRGQGTFWGQEGTNPAVGEQGKLETVDEVRLEMVCPAKALPRAADVLYRIHPYEEPAWDVYALAAKPRPGSGMGRRVTLAVPAKLDALVDRIKHHLDLKQVRVAAAAPHQRGEPVRVGAVCAGAGGSVFKSVQGVDLLLTGEMSHHDVRWHVGNGTSVVLCDHTNTERGFLPEFGRRLAGLCNGQLSVHVSQRDRDPLEIV